MKKVALVFVAAVFVPSLVLAWLAVRSLRDQQFLIERQQSLLYQSVTDALAKQIQDALADDQHVFTLKVAAMLHGRNPMEIASSFDDLLRKGWPLAEVGFVVSLSGQILSPSPSSRPQANLFCVDNSRFLANRESAEVYWSPKQPLGNTAPNASVENSQAAQVETKNDYAARYANSSKSLMTRSVVPQQQAPVFQNFAGAADAQQPYSKVAASEAEFRQLIGDDDDGTIARFVDNKLNVLFWTRSSADSQLVFGAKISVSELEKELQGLIGQLEPGLRQAICVALLDDTAKPVLLSQPGFHGSWKRPFVATEIGEALPHWEVAVYLLDPAKLARSAQALKLTLGLLIALLVLAIGMGSWLIVADLSRQITLARQKTDFVSNVSHELKTPLTSIRMFSELLAEGRVSDAGKQRSYLGIISAEAARLTRLINNVLDFARLERGEKKYNFQRCDLGAVVSETVETYRPHLEAAGFRFETDLPDPGHYVSGDRDALAQVIVNLLSNAEKYSDQRKEIQVRAVRQTTPLPFVEVKVLDRGIGVPGDCAERIFEKFFRAHDSVSSGIQGSGLGLTLARQIARAHGGDVYYEPREGGGSCFSLRLPLAPGENPHENENSGC